MREISLNESEFSSQRQKMLLPSALLMMLALLAGLFVLVFLSDSSDEINFLYPNNFLWLLLTLISTTAPLVFYWAKGRFELFNPIIFASWSYFVPVFVVGGFIFITGFSQPPYSYLIGDPKNDIPRTFIYVSVGFLALWAGYEMAFARRIGRYFAAKIPEWNWTAADLALPGYILLGIGIIFNVTTWMAGILMGFQTVAQIDSLDNIQYFLSLLVFEGSFLLWMVFFRTERKKLFDYITLAVLLFIIPLRIIFAGSRGSFYQLFLMAAMAYLLSGKKLNAKKGFIFAGFLTGAILLGMIWGNTFRNVKGDDTRISSGEYLSTVERTADSISSVDASESLTNALGSFSERLENFSVLAVVVSNYEKLAPYEEAYGLKDNIWTYTWTAFIPRLVWQDKPIISGARDYSELYFDYGENSFPVTPIGDLLRNFGVYGIPAGMFVLGIFLRIMYVLLIEGREVSIWRGMTYFMLITKVSYEGFYGTILPDIVRTVFIVLISLGIIKFLCRKN